MAWGCGAWGLVPVRPWSTPEFKRRLLPLVFSSVICMLLGNAGYFRLSLSFLNILKALTPAVTLGVSAAVGAETFTPMAFISTMLIAYGTGTATMQETSNNKAFHWLSFLAFLLSVFFEASRVVLAQKLLGGMAQPYNPIEMLAHAGPGVAACMGFGALVWEAKELAAIGLSGWIRLAPDLVVLCVLSFLVNISSYYAIQNTSSTTFKVAGCFKNAVVIWIAAVQGDMVTRKQWEGFGVSTAGFLLYTWAKSRSSGPDDADGGRKKKAT